MSLDPRELKVGDRVIFCGRVAKEVATTSSEFFCDIWFKGGMRLKCDDELWEQAELVKPSPPRALNIAELNNEDCYILDDHNVSYSPEYFLSLLKRDVSRLEAAGVKEA
jgi:hypothetical protein